MKKKVLYSFATIVVLLLSVACASEEEKYNTSVLRQFELFLDDAPWALNVGISTKPIFIYNADNGMYYGNYSSHYRFALENGNYKVLATPYPDHWIPDSSKAVNFQDLIVAQKPTADFHMEMSPAVDAGSPFDDMVQLKMKTRTGVLRLRSSDMEVDANYNYPLIHTIIDLKRSGYYVKDETYVEEPMQISRYTKTETGGVNYLEDLIVFETKEGTGVNVRLELMKADSTIVMTRELVGDIEVKANYVSVVEFQLNNREGTHSQISDYELSIIPRR